MTDDLEAHLFEHDPITEPLSYPGIIPDTSGILIDDSFRALQAVSGKEPEHWLVSSTTLASLIEQLGCGPLSARVPVLAVGSNASPSQLLRKFAGRSVRPVVPITLADVTGIVPGVSAHVSKPGYIPAVPVVAQGATSRLSVLWLDSVQLNSLDETEPNYWRRELAAESFPVKLVSGVVLPQCFLYIGKHGCLVNAAGRPRGMVDQRTLIQELLDESPRLRGVCGETPDEFVTRAQDPAVRETVKRIFAEEGRVLVQPGLDRLPESLLSPRRADERLTERLPARTQTDMGGLLRKPPVGRYQRRAGQTGA